MAIRLWALIGALLGPVLGIPLARAADFPVVIECPSWSGEQAGQVEARIRAALQADGLVATDISVVCGPADALEARVTSPDGVLARQVTRRSEHVEDDVVWTVEAALNELKLSGSIAAAPEVTPAPAPAPLPPPLPALVPPPASPAPVNLVAPGPPQREVELALRLLIERFSNLWALGAEASGSVGNDSLSFGLALGGRVALAEPSDFQLSELTGSARLSLSPPRMAGMRIELGMGLSALSIVPRDGAVAESATALSAGFAELSLSRPFWLGSLAVSPTLGARAFFARRSVEVDGQERFALPSVVPQLGLALIYRL
jgi:hypothetical protein